MSTRNAGPSPTARMHSPNAWLREGRALLNQQCWLWGQDIRREDGNLLLQYGFERTRPPEGVSGSTQYTLQLASDRCVRLWGFGIYFGGKTGIYLNRYEFITRSATLADTWQSADSMKRLPRCSRMDLIAEAADWIAQYETWVLRQAGLAYRSRALSKWEAAVSVPSCVALSWQSLSRRVKATALQGLSAEAAALLDGAKTSPA